jgi:predicted CopG family antitoxin
MDYEKFKQIVISQTNYDKLKEINPDESFNKIISRLILEKQQHKLGVINIEPHSIHVCTDVRSE